ncbi:MAG TPA: M13 family metallopeptidase [Pyrinomonadaceae bacterium]|jgi:putative endopeptidase
MRSRNLICVPAFLFVLSLGLILPGDWTSHAAREQAVSSSTLAGQSETASGPDAASASVNTSASDNHGFDVSNLDRSASACENFYQFATGGWRSRNEIPGAYPRWGRFNELADRNQEQLHQILEEAAKNKKARKGSNEQKIGDYYASCMDEDRIETLGLKPIAPELKRIAGIKDQRGLIEEAARLHGMGVPVLFRLGSGPDYKKSTDVIAQLSQGGLGLPDRDYYTKTDDKSKELREKYAAHISQMLRLAGDEPSTAEREAAAVLAIETRLAEASLTRVERRNPDNTYHKMDAAQLKTLSPNLPWDMYFKNVGLRTVGDINVAQPNFFKTLDSQLSATPLADWKAYLRWHLVKAYAPRLSKKFVEEDFEFSGKTLQGTKELLPRWKRCVSRTDAVLGEALGQVYVKKTFSPEAKARALSLVQNLVAALREDLSTLDWMSDTTRQRAIAKLEAFTKKIGYPDTWRDYSALKIERQAFVENSQRANLFEFNRQLRKIARPVDKTEWGMTPPTVNAYYNPTYNEIVFPAGILQFPFYDPQADDAINYGGIGAVIGHEMTHGFDDSGAKFDAQGNLSMWWTPEDFKNFQQRARCVIDQFDSFEVQSGLNHNGKLVVGESIADLGGVTIAYAALQKSMEGKPRPPAIDGFTPEQRFFLGYAQIWAENSRPEYERLQVATDPHPLGRFRVNGPLSNIPAFAAAYQCKAGDPMVRPASKRCRIW